MTQPAGRTRKKAVRTERRDVTVNLRATESWRTLVDRAATTLDKTRSEFIVEATRRHAEDVLLDRRFFALDVGSFRAFAAILDDPPPPNAALVRLMNRKAPWQR